MDHILDFLYFEKTIVVNDWSSETIKRVIDTLYYFMMNQLEENKYTLKYFRYITGPSINHINADEIKLEWIVNKPKSD